mmetsp:Transcript_20917/g.53390  ORF Transcript_20917/g.53390 Transcript_20917/m.53390 type:complete len:250 (+) Transcript_20917:393-1142(+)
MLENMFGGADFINSAARRGRMASEAPLPLRAIASPVTIPATKRYALSMHTDLSRGARYWSTFCSSTDAAFSLTHASVESCNPIGGACRIPLSAPSSSRRSAGAWRNKSLYSFRMTNFSIPSEAISCASSMGSSMKTSDSSRRGMTSDMNLWIRRAACGLVRFAGNLPTNSRTSLTTAWADDCFNLSRNSVYRFLATVADPATESSADVSVCGPMPAGYPAGPSADVSGASLSRPSFEVPAASRLVPVMP